ncbi:MAG: KOW domain-containing RNA-binding protein [Oscillospiraceae bacterium]|nr:KOW domain-containing RNA-binding protein [Oscillospiraceae bacterium]
MDLKRGDVVRSLAGHDKGRLFCIVDVQDDVLWLANGKQRRIGSPKRKNCRHVRPAGTFEHSVLRRLRAGEPVGDGELRKALAEFRDAIDEQQRREDTGVKG